VFVLAAPDLLPLEGMLGFPCRSTPFTRAAAAAAAAVCLPVFPCAAPEAVATKLLLLLSACNQLARVQISVHISTGSRKDEQQQQHHHHHHHPQQQQEAAAAAGGGGGGVGGPAGGNAAAGAAAGGNAGNGGGGEGEGGEGEEEEDAEALLGFLPDDSEYCYGWVARFLQELQQQQQQQQAGTWPWQWALSSSSSGSSMLAAAAVATAVQKRQLLQPLLVWKPDDLKQQQQQHRLWVEQQHRLWVEQQQGNSQQQQQQLPPLVVELAIDGAAFPSDATDWQQLQHLNSLAKLLLPATKPCLLPCMVSDSSNSSSSSSSGGGGVACLQQLQALQLSVEAGFSAPSMAHAWGLGVGHEGAGLPSSIQGLSCLSRLTHLALHSNGASTREMTAAVVKLTRLRELLLSGSSIVHLPAVVTRLTNLELLVLQQQVGMTHSLSHTHILVLACMFLVHICSHTHGHTHTHHLGGGGGLGSGEVDECE